MYAGVGVTLVEIIPASAIQFGVYALLHAAAMKAEGRDDSMGSGERLSSVGNAACGFGAGCVARLIIHPLDVVKKRFQVAGLARSLRYGERVVGLYKLNPVDLTHSA
jgi:solute carrier family 25 thiamine pyrophosphate transporter 19